MCVHISYQARQRHNVQIERQDGERFQYIFHDFWPLGRARRHYDGEVLHPINERFQQPLWYLVVEEGVQCDDHEETHYNYHEYGSSAQLVIAGRTRLTQPCVREPRVAWGA